MESLADISKLKVTHLVQKDTFYIRLFRFNGLNIFPVET